MAIEITVTCDKCRGKTCDEYQFTCLEMKFVSGIQRFDFCDQCAIRLLLKVTDEHPVQVEDCIQGMLRNRT